MIFLALRYEYKYEYKKLYHHTPHQLSNDFFLRVYVSFDDWKFIPHEKFEWIEEWHAQEDRKYLIGVIAFKELKENNWWRENNTSLILTPDPIIEDVEIRKLKKKSLEFLCALTGIDYEVVVVDDGSADKTKQQILENADDRTILVELRKNYGQSTAMTAGIDYSHGKYVALLDGDLQNDPTDIP